MKPLSWLSVKWALFFAAMFESNQTWYMIKKIRLQYIVCAGKLGGMSCCLVQQQSKLMFMLVISITGIFLTHQILNPIPLCGFWLWLVRESIISLAKTGVPSSARWLCFFCSFHHQWLWQSLSGGCNISALLVDATSSQSNAQCLLPSFRQTAQVNSLLLTLSATQLHVGKIVTTSQQFALPRLGKWKQFLF